MNTSIKRSKSVSSRTGIHISSPIGDLSLFEQEGRLIALEFASLSGTLLSSPLLEEAVRQLNAYFAGRLKQFDLPLAPTGTPFEQKAWNTLLEIPYGQTLSYSQQAVQMGCPKAHRAVGSANGKNPLPIFIPCHRVIRRDHTLGGYAGGLSVKSFLLSLEKGA